MTSNTTIIEVRSVKDLTYPGKFAAQVVVVEPNGTRHIIAGWQPVRGRRELKQLATTNRATINEVS